MQTAITAIFQRVIVRPSEAPQDVLGPLRAQRRWRVSAVVTKPCRKGPIIGNRMASLPGLCVVAVGLFVWSLSGVALVQSVFILGGHLQLLGGCVGVLHAGYAQWALASRASWVIIRVSIVSRGPMVLGDWDRAHLPLQLALGPSPSLPRFYRGNSVPWWWLRFKEPITRHLLNHRAAESGLRALLKPPANDPTVVSLLRLQPEFHLGIRSAQLAVVWQCMFIYYTFSKLPNSGNSSTTMTLTTTWELGFCVSEMMLFLKANPTLLTDLVYRLMPGATPSRVMATRHIFALPKLRATYSHLWGMSACLSIRQGTGHIRHSHPQDDFATSESPNRM
ncbi:hypothetical protein EDB85DRAFT_1887336 [Lactarius pseudohatsudake]|nr:hypothetical protein EDB85DRAFT_1887336 [Lactarius pseudohatsudake]